MTALLDKHPATPDPDKEATSAWSRLPKKLRVFIGATIIVVIVAAIASLIVGLVTHSRRQAAQEATLAHHDRHLTDYLSAMGVTAWGTAPITIGLPFDCSNVTAESKSWNLLFWGKTNVTTTTETVLCYASTVSLGGQVYPLAVPATAINYNSGAETAMVTLANPVVDEYRETVNCYGISVFNTDPCPVTMPPALDPAQLQKFKDQGLSAIISANAVTVDAPRPN